MNYYIFDTHSHLHDKAYDADREEVIKEMKSSGMGTICIGTDLNESKNALNLAKKHENIFASVGLHPADNVLEEFNYEEFEKLGNEQKVVALGECGLDYFYIEKFFEKDRIEKKISHNKDQEADRQKDIFEKHIELAVKLNKPLMIHGRPSTNSQDAYEDILFMLEKAREKYGDTLRGNIHFFVGDINIAKRFIDLGFTLSFSGVITFTKDYDEVIKFLPIENILPETDSPYVAPHPYRGKRNNPNYVVEVIKRIAEIKGMNVEEINKVFEETRKRVFGI